MVVDAESVIGDLLMTEALDAALSDEVVPRKYILWSYLVEL